MQMDHDTLANLSKNIRLLMKYHGDSQEKLAIKSGVAQTTIGNMINPGRTKKGPTIENVATVAEAYDLEAWHLLIPGQPIEVLIDKSIENLVHNYNVVDEGGRKNLERISEKEVAYNAHSKEIDKISSENTYNRIHKRTS